MLTRSLALLLCSGLAFAAAGPTFPVLTYSSYLRDNFTPNAIATDASGNIYLAGSAIIDGPDLQTTALVVKLKPQATQYLYVRYLGGSVYDAASAITVDSGGNAYVVGATASADFPVSSGGHLGTAPTGLSDKRSFAAKLDPNGQLVFSDLLGGSAFSEAQAVVVSAAGQIVVTGTSGPGFPSTPGAYSVANTVNHPYLLELDPTGTKTIFSATGIGGSSLALDSSGDIYVAGTTYLLDYPTTPGAFQTTFPTIFNCLLPCQIPSPGANQYVTKVDPTGSKLIFSTSVSGTSNTLNAGLAVDSAGAVYLTGLEGGGYPFTVTPPALPALPVNDLEAISAVPFLSKLDPSGQKLLFSVPVGGAGVQVDSSGFAYAGGMLGLSMRSFGSSLGYYVGPSLPALANVPTACLPNATFIQNSAYVSQVEASSGMVLGSKFIGGSTLNISGVVLSGSTLWMAGTTNFPDFPFSPNALTVQYFGPGPQPGAYLGAVEFSQPEPPAGTPQIGCILDAADLADAGPVASYQLLTIFGSGLGPAKGVSATDNITGVLAGVDVSFGSTPSPLLYVSSTQINFAVPADVTPSSAMQVTVSGVSSVPRQIPLTFRNPSLFLSNSPAVPALGSGFFAVALNADGSLNSLRNPAHLGSVISVFVNGVSPNPDVESSPLQFATTDGWSVTGSSQATPFVVRVDLRIPSPLITDLDCPPSISVCAVGFVLYDIDFESVDPQVISTGDLALGADVYVTRT